MDFEERRQKFRAILDAATAATGTDYGYACACCGYPGLRERDANQICTICWWEDDGRDDDAETAQTGPGARYTLTKARANFEAGGLMYEKDERPDLLTLERSHLLAAYDRILERGDYRSYLASHPRIEALEKSYTDAFKRERKLRGRLH
jgi:hypothetical protein